MFNFLIRNGISSKFSQIAPSIFMDGFNRFSFSFLERFAKLKQNFSLFLFKAEERINSLDKPVSFQVSKLKRVKGLSLFSRWFFNTIMTAKVFVNKLYGFWLNLFNSNSLIVLRIFTIFDYSDIISILFNRKVPIAIHNASEISQSYFIHKSIIHRYEGVVKKGGDVYG